MDLIDCPNKKLKGNFKDIAYMVANVEYLLKYLDSPFIEGYTEENIAERIACAEKFMRKLLMRKHPVLE